MLNPNSIDDIHDKSSISKASQFSNRPSNLRGESLGSEDKKNFISPTNPLPGTSDSNEYGAAPLSRKRTHSGLSLLVGSRKSPFPSDIMRS